MSRTAHRPRSVPTAPLTESASDLAALFGGVLLRPLASGRFALLGPPTPWWATLWPELDADAADLRAASLFLHSFLLDADAFWASDTAGPLGSGLWAEPTPDGSALLLEAFALHLASGPALLVRPPSVPVAEYQHALQQSREQALTFAALRRDLQRLEDALACLMHDTATPLASVRGSLEFLRQDGQVQPSGRELLDIAQSQADRLYVSLRGVFDALSASQAPSKSPAGVYPDLRSLVHAAVDRLQLAFDARDVAVQVDEPAHALPATPLRVVAEQARLERVLSHLLDNALHHAPPGSSVTVTLAHDAAGVCVDVVDAGPPVPETEAEVLFHRPTRVPDGRGGLGLYFCRVTVEGWGGTIGYTLPPTGGARFWCRLLSPTSSLPHSLPTL